MHLWYKKAQIKCKYFFLPCVGQKTLHFTFVFVWWIKDNSTCIIYIQTSASCLSCSCPLYLRIHPIVLGFTHLLPLHQYFFACPFFYRLLTCQNYSCQWKFCNKLHILDFSHKISWMLFTWIPNVFRDFETTCMPHP